MREIKNDPRFVVNSTYDEVIRNKAVIKTRSMGPTEFTIEPEPKKEDKSFLNFLKDFWRGNTK